MKPYVCLLLVCLGMPSFGQQGSEHPQFSTYYYQRKTLFDLLPNSEHEIIFLGNSITDGGEWTELFSDLNIKNRGISGDITDGVLFRLDEVLESNPVKIFIMIGTNDLAIGRTQDEILRNFIKIMDRISRESPQTKVYIQSILPVNNTFNQFPNHTNKSDEIQQMNAKLRELAISRSFQFIDLDPVFTDESGRLKKDFTNDGLHLTGPGYMAWKHVLKPYLDMQ